MQYLQSAKKLKKYDLFLIDQWGVIHDGEKKFKEAYKVLLFLKKLGKKIVIISNSSENASYTSSITLKKLKINNKIFDKIVTSGEIFENEIELIKNKFKKKYLKCLCISAFDKKKLLKKKNILITNNLDQIDFILASSIKPNLNLINLKKKLNECRVKQIPMICTNPDKKVFNGNVKKLVEQVGVLAAYYKKIGGKVKFYGKPHSRIYKECLMGYRGIVKKKVLMIGDSIENDILGAQKFKIDTLFILNGNHKNEFIKLNNNEIKEKISQTWKKIRPTYFSPTLKI
tara:strand:+ start:1982 stop:2839 length:858 start_codon:yes stop_codon:yes gene_type:complete